tara:strand:- start:41 stop:1018 length:978 start_codon:yes stop_codon:yes gene_type:complete
MKKYINRRSFDEKLIHRFFLETIYLDKIKGKKLLPSKFPHKISDLKLVVPEDKYNNYRADFSLYFKNEDKKRYPVEIKWKGSDLKRKNQIQELEKNDGFLVSFDSPVLDIPFVKIDKKDFKEWLVKRVDVLFDETLSQKVKEEKSNNKWIVTLRGAAWDNFSKMEDFTSNMKKRFWAFVNTTFVMNHMLHFKRGDKILFLFIKTKHPEGSGMQPNSNKDFELYRACFGEITNPYYMELDGERSTFFEKDNYPINKRKWPHFFDFHSYKNYNFSNPVCISRRQMDKGLKRSIANSSNQMSSMENLSDRQFEEIQGLIRAKYSFSTK